MTIKTCPDKNVALVLFAAANVQAFRELLMQSPVSALEALGIDTDGIDDTALNCLPDGNELNMLGVQVVEELVQKQQVDAENNPCTTQVIPFIDSLRKCNDDDDDTPFRTYCEKVGARGIGLAARLAFDDVFYELAKCNPCAALRLMGFKDVSVAGVDGSRLVSQAELRCYIENLDAEMAADDPQVKEFWSDK